MCDKNQEMTQVPGLSAQERAAILTAAIEAARLVAVQCDCDSAKKQTTAIADAVISACLSAADTLNRNSVLI